MRELERVKNRLIAENKILFEYFVYAIGFLLVAFLLDKFRVMIITPTVYHFIMLVTFVVSFVFLINLLAIKKTKKNLDKMMNIKMR